MILDRRLWLQRVLPVLEGVTALWRQHETIRREFTTRDNVIPQEASSDTLNTGWTGVCTAEDRLKSGMKRTVASPVHRRQRQQCVVLQ